MIPQTFYIGVDDQKSEIRVGQSLSKLPKALTVLAPIAAKVGLVVDGAVANRYGRPLLRSLRTEGYEAELFVVPPGERSKSLEQAGKLYRALAKSRFERGSWLLAMGGGVVGDLAGFVAATFLRGIPVVQIPTTLLAQVDSSIGGKTGVDIPEGKNLVGSFYQPRLVWVDPTLLKSLPKDHWRNGMGEVIKYGAIRDEVLFQKLEQKMELLLKGYHAEWEAIIARCAQIKADVVDKDPHERRGLRALLNFGHSVGHAVEAAGGYKLYSHGEAISIGMFVASQLSQVLAGLDPVDRIRLGTLLTRAGLPSQPRRPIKRDRLLSFLARDKKVKEGAVRFVLLEKLGKAVSGKQVPMETLDRALAASSL